MSFREFVLFKAILTKIMPIGGSTKEDIIPNPSNSWS